MAVYRNKSSIVEYLAAGGITGSLYKVNMGLRGMAVGGILGGALGGVAGLLSLLVLRLSGTSMEEVRYWQYKWRLDREKTIRETPGVILMYILYIIYLVSIIFYFFFILQKEEKDEMLLKHDEHYGTKKISLELLDEPTNDVKIKADKK